MRKIHYQTYTDSPNKPWVMLIHGLFGNLDNLSALRRLLIDDYQVLAVDLLDHGQSSFSDSFSFSNNAQAIVELIQTLKVEQITLVGHSLGGKVAMQIALDHAELVSHLVILDIAPVKYGSRHTEVFKGLKSVPLASLTSRKEAEQALGVFVKEKPTMQFLLKSLYNQDGAWRWRFNLDLLHRDYQKLTAAIESENNYQGPVLFIKGSLSDYLLLEHRPAVVKLFPNSQSKVIANTGHWLHAEKPELCVQLIRDFLHK
jgi:esterase